ncbi:MAG TPA: hypothetical protein VMC09_13200 [Anaerolineales bacterium]|nr:hypothetical protein [Anaerolineales bacterium]
MKPILRNYRGEEDHWRWHCIANCQSSNPHERVTHLWETPTVQLAAVVGGYDPGQNVLYSPACDRSEGWGREW